MILIEFETSGRTLIQPLESLEHATCFAEATYLINGYEVSAAEFERVRDLVRPYVVKPLSYTLKATSDDVSAMREATGGFVPVLSPIPPRPDPVQVILKGTS